MRRLYERRGNPEVAGQFPTLNVCWGDVKGYSDAFLRLRAVIFDEHSLTRPKCLETRCSMKCLSSQSFASTMPSPVLGEESSERGALEAPSATPIQQLFEGPTAVMSVAKQFFVSMGTVLRPFVPSRIARDDRGSRLTLKIHPNYRQL